MNAEKMMKIIGDADDEYIQSALDSRRQKTTRKPLRLVFRAVAAAAIIMSLTITAYATDGQIIKSLVSGFWSKSYSSFEDLDKAMEKAGFEIDVKEEFESGYVFDSMHVDTTHGLDENRDKKLTYKGIDIVYKNPSGHRLFLNTHPDLEAIPHGENPVTESRQIGGITVEYLESYYKFLPVERELTEEEKLWEQAPDHYISYGSDEAHECKITHLGWTKDGISYSFMDMDAEVSADILFSMAEELITIP